LALMLVGTTIVSLRYAHATSEYAQRITLERKRADHIKLFLVDMLKSADPNLGSAADVTVKSMVQDKFASIEHSFTDDPGTKLELLQVFAEVFEVLRLSERQKQALNLQLGMLAQTTGARSAQYASTLAARARAEEKLGDYDSAFATVDQALKINTALHLPKGVAENYHELGLLHHLKGEHAEAADFYERALGIRRAEYGEGSPEFADTLYELGVLDDELGRRAEAEQRIRRVLELRRQIFGSTHTAVAEVLMALGTNLSGQKRLDEAIATNTEALAMYEALFGPENRYANGVINNLGHDYWRKGDLSRARLEFEKALALTRRFYPGHPDEAIVLLNIGDVSYAMKDHRAALDRYLASLPIFETHMPRHPVIHKIRLRIGLCLGNLARVAEGEK
jgi:tetratricopeptide (TPR) repeat protein